MPNLLLIMTPGVNLSVWKDNGSFSREIKPYLAYGEAGFKIRIISFGQEKHDFSSLSGNIEIIPAKRGFFPTHLLLITHREHFTWADVIKTNQSYLSWVFVLAGKMYKRPVLLRCGFVQGEYLETTNAPRLRSRIYQFFEGLAFRFAEHVQVPTETLAQWVIRRYRVSQNNLTVLPNFIDIKLFSSQKNDGTKVLNSVISVGRLHPVKRFDLLIRACAIVPGGVLTIVGEGPSREYLAALAKESCVRLSLPGNIPNENLPRILSEHQIFAVTSLREGHPKALLEAMGCGLPSVCVRTVGVEEILLDSGGGLLAEPDPVDISAKMLELFRDDSKRRSLGSIAREFVETRCSFEKVFAVELATVKRLGLAQRET